MSPDAAERAERAYAAAVLDGLDDQLDRARANMRAQVTELREHWSSGVAQQVAASEARIRQMQEDNLTWLRNLYADESAPSELAAGALGDAPAASPSTGHGPRQQPDPYAAELQRAQELKDMDMATYARLRTELGIRSATDLNRLG